MASLNAACIGGGPAPSCMTYRESQGADGTVYFQQASPGASIPWSVSPKDAVFADGQADWVVDVYVGDRRVDHKEQNYAPHGSINSVDVVPGETAKVKGTVTARSAVLIGNIEGHCTIA